MIPFNNHNGFTFIEILLTISMIGAILSPLLSVQYSVMQIMARATDKLSRIFIIENWFNEAEYKNKEASEKETSVTKKILDPDTDLTYVIQKPDAQKSSLRKLEDIYLLRVKAQWHRFGLPFNETMVSFMYQPKEQKEAQPQPAKATA